MKKLVLNDSVMDKISHLVETSELLISKMVERRLYFKFNNLE